MVWSFRDQLLGANDERIQLEYRGTEAGSQHLRQQAKRGIGELAPHQAGLRLSLQWSEKPEAARSLGSQAGRFGYRTGLLSALRSRNWEGPDAGWRLRSSLEVMESRR